MSHTCGIAKGVMVKSKYGEKTYYYALCKNCNMASKYCDNENTAYLEWVMDNVNFDCNQAGETVVSEKPLAR